MSPEEQQILNEAVQKLRQATNSKDEGILLLAQLLERTFTVEPAGGAAGGGGGGAGSQTFIVGPAAAAAPRTNETFTVEQGTAVGANATFTVQPAAAAVNNRTYTVNSNSSNEAGPGPVCSSPIRPGRLVNNIPSPSESPISAAGPASILRPFGNPGGRALNAGRRVSFDDSNAGSGLNSSQSCQRPLLPNYSGFGNSTGVTNYPDRRFTGSTYQDEYTTSLDSASFGRIWTAPPQLGSSSRNSQLRNWMESSASSSSGTGSIPGTATFADMNSSRVESSNEGSTSTASAVYCPHCGHMLNMNVNIQAPVNTSNTSEQNLRIRINIFDDSDSGSSNSNSALAQGSMNSNNQLGVNCPNCRQRIHLRLNIRQNLGNSSDSEQEYQVQIGLLASPESSCTDSRNSRSNRSQFSVYNCGDCPTPTQPKPRPKGDKS